jgi:hypothetical protein
VKREIPVVWKTICSSLPPKPTQMERARVLRDRLLAHFPDLADINDEIRALQTEQANVSDDKSISQDQFNQLQTIHHHLRDLLIAQLFDAP